ncbi:MAG: Gfo/Idh/MocA family oxidoreductase, partial [Planctomycetota bacterium]
PAPSERIAMACIGVGGRCGTNLGIFEGTNEVVIVAVCEIDSRHLSRGLQRAGLDAKSGYHEFRDVLKRKDIDAVMVGTPDHWHALVTIAAIQAGKDVYCEKPLAASVAESQAVVRAVQKSDRILQCGTQRRSMSTCRFACELVRNGRIGKLRRVECGVPGRFAIRGGYTGLEAPQSIPKEFDYKRWLGPCDEAPYTAARCHFNFRWVNDYAPGYITDWGAHYLDIAAWGIGMDESGPSEIEALDVRTRKKGIYDAPESFQVVYRYPNGVEAVLISTTDTSRYGMKFIGDEGTVFVEGQKVVTTPSSMATTKIKDSEIRLYDAKNDHHGNFVDCVRSRKQPSAPVHIAHRSASICEIGAISCELGRKLRWDPKAEKFIDDKEADRKLSRPMRDPWSLPKV